MQTGHPLQSRFDQLKHMCDSVHIPLLVYLHAEQTGLSAGKYNDQGDEIISWCTTNNVPIVKDLDHGLTVSDFRDNIHLSAHGQRNMANHIKRYVKTDIETLTYPIIGTGKVP